MAKNTYISDIIDDEDIAGWTPDRPVIILAPTGRGKSTFVMNRLFGRILLLVHRTRIKEQFKKKLQDADRHSIDVKSYQWLSWHVAHGDMVDLREYEYIVCDEFHYFLNDSNFNYTTDIAFDYIMNEGAVKIFLSATGKKTEKIITDRVETEPVRYEITEDFSWVESLTFYTDDEHVHGIIRGMPDDEKAIVYINNYKRLERIYNDYAEDALFCVSKSAPDHFTNLMDEQAVQRMLMEEKFESRLLLTTSVLDTGVTIKDAAVKTIIVDIKDPDTIVQCLGRLRRDSNAETVRVYIRHLSGRQIGGLMAAAFDRISEAVYLLTCGQAAFYERYVLGRAWHNRGIVYVDTQGQYHVNRLMLAQCRAQVAEYREITHGREKPGRQDSHWQAYMADVLHKRFWSVLSSEEAVLEKLFLYGPTILPRVKDRRAVIEAAGVRDRKGRLLRSRETLNAFFAERGLPYHIGLYTGSYMSVRCRDAWRLEYRMEPYVPDNYDEWIQDDYSTWV